MSAKCGTCTKSVYANEEIKSGGKSYHNTDGCFKCQGEGCGKRLTASTVNPNKDGHIYCKGCSERANGHVGLSAAGAKYAAN